MGSEAGLQRAGEAKKNAKKRHSFTSLSTAGRAAQAPPQRHSMEISGPVLISSSNPTAAARIGELSGGLSCSAPSQVGGAHALASVYRDWQYFQLFKQTVTSAQSLEVAPTLVTWSHWGGGFHGNPGSISSSQMFCVC